jgi:quercetin dioxygenase-like cupin family protein
MKFHMLLLFALLSVLALAAQTVPGEVPITSEPSHHLTIDNEYVRVFKVEFPSQASSLMHRHAHDYIFVSIGPASIENDVAGKPPTTVKLQDGDTRFTPGNFAHMVKNLGDGPFRNVTVEIMQDEKARQSSPPPWDEERGLLTFAGGTRDILFVKDGVRASDIQLQPGATMPKHAHSGPHLLVAVTDLDVRSDVEGQGPMPGHFKAGDVKWLPGGYSHTLTNTGKQAARFVTLEFH